MTSETPPPSRRPRPGADARRRALGLDEGDGADGDALATQPATAAPATPADAAAARRESLRESLSRIPDLSPDDPLLQLTPVAPVDSLPVPATPPAPAKKQAAKPAAPARPKRAAVAAAAGTAATVAAPQAKTAEAKDADAKAPEVAAPEAKAAEAAPLTAPVQPQVAFTPPTAPPEPAGDRYAGRSGIDPLASTATVPGDGGSTPPPEVRVPRSGRSKPPMWRRITFAIVLIGLIAAIPVLGYAGYHLVSESKDGQFTGTTLSPQDPGYEAPVDPTPTAVAIQYDDQHMPTGVTFLSLAGDEGGGSVVFVPLDTEVSEPSYGVDRLRTSYEVVADRPAVARERLASQVGRLLNVGVDEIIDLDNAGWEQLVTTVGPLTIDNPDQIDLGFGGVIPSGETTLQPGQVGPYLAATIEGESDLNRLARHEAVWTAWLDQLAESGKAEAVPGESTAGISKFAKTLASGPVTFDTLPVNSVPGLIPLFRIDKDEVNQLITDTVASPTAAVPGSRFTVRLLNGVSADGIPSDLVRQIVGRGGAVTVLGNGPQFGADETTVVYANPADKDLATLIAESIGATGKVRLDREAPDTVDLTIVLGKDVLGDATGAGAPGATTPETTAPGGD
ncbi:MAG TPA: LytR C-terminal domain-containing protein [Acidimicrobiales bacterium]|nr:LytR C-terminal domain-containing protein [Acidimicrobiales bacterium]